MNIEAVWWHTFISLLIQKDLCDHQKISVKLLRALFIYLHFWSADPYIISLRVTPFLFQVLGYCT